jgi:CRP-like cAMP-binding protein
MDSRHGVNPDLLASLLATTPTITARRGQLFCMPGLAAEALFILRSGRVNIYRITADGHKLITATLGEGAIFGLRWLVNQESGSYAEAADDCVLCVLTRAEIQRLITTEPELALSIMALLADRIEEADTRLERFAFGSVTARLAAALLAVADGTERQPLRITHQELAEMIGANRETVTRTLDTLRDRGVIRLQRQSICILDPEGLRRLSAA